MKLVDTHTHIYSEKYDDDFSEIISRAEKELEFIISIGYDLESSKKGVELAKKYDFVYSVVGIHPVDIKKYNDEVEQELIKMATDEPKVVAIGEIGLDYHWMEDPKEVQEEIKAIDLKLAKLSTDFTNNIVKSKKKFSKNISKYCVFPVRQTSRMNYGKV